MANDQQQLPPHSPMVAMDTQGGEPCSISSKSQASTSQEPTNTTPSSSSSSMDLGAHGTQSNWQLLLELPHDLFTRSVVEFFTAGDKKAFRSASRLCRSLVNAATASCTLDVCCPSTLHAMNQLPLSFPQLAHVSICHALGMNISSNDSSSEGQAAEFQQQLPQVLQQLPHLNSFSYEGPTNRREQCIDLLPALQALAVAAAAEGGGGGGGGWQPEPPDSQPQTPQPPPLQQQQLTRLLLRAGKLPESLLDTVGQLKHLCHLQLTATTAINTAPLSQLQQLTELHFTVTPPLTGALGPLAALKHLQVLHLAAISPARGWAAALGLLQGCNLQDLELVFADICDDDIAAVGELKGLTRLDLHCSRHLTPAAVPHIAQLPQLSALHLGDTGLQLGPVEMLLLGSGCTKLTELHAEFDLRGLPSPGDFPASDPARATLLTSNLRQQTVLQAELVGLHREATPWPPISYLHATCWFGSNEFAKMLHWCKTIRRLELDDAGPGADGVAATLANHAAQITALRLTGCNSLTEKGCAAIAEGLRGLQELEVIGMHGFRLSPLLQHIGGRTRLVTNTASHSDGLTRLYWQHRLRDVKEVGAVAYVAGQGLLSSLQQLQICFHSCLPAPHSPMKDIVAAQESLLSLAGNLPCLTELEITCEGFDDEIGRKFETAIAQQVLLKPGLHQPVQRVICRHPT